jgi:hypothetical protein
MDSSPIVVWKNAAAYFTFANHEAVVFGVFLASVVATLYVIGAIMKHEKRSEEALRGYSDSVDSAELIPAEEPA